MSKFEDLLTSYQKRINQTLEDVLPSDNTILTEAMRYSVLNGGKRLRPILVYLTGELGNADRNSLDVLASSIELVHCYSLIHDCLLYTSPSPRDGLLSRMPSSA